MLFGGLQDGNGLNDTWVWSDGDWTELHPQDFPSPRYGAPISYDAAHRETVLFGGSACDDAGCRPVAETWTWDGTNWTEEKPPQSPPPLHAASMAYDGTSERVVLFGGCLVAACPSPTQTWTWDGTTWTRHLGATAPSPRHGASMAFDAARGVTLLFGGIGADGSNLADTWSWDGSAWTQIPTPTTPPARAFAGMTYNASSREIFLYGGGRKTCPTCTSFLQDAWTWDGQEWSPVQASGPPPIEDVGLVYDRAADEVVLFGGRGKVAGADNVAVGALRDTWTWNGSDWHRHESSWPEERQNGALVYDPVSGMTLMVGGNCGFDETCAVWAWDGASWTKLSDLPRVWHLTPTFHPNSQKVVLPVGTFVREWDGACRTWTSKTPTTSPVPRVGFGFAPDRNGNAVLFGGQGCGGSCYLNDTWVWDGVDWTRIDPPRKPTGRAFATISYDPVRRETVLFGGLKDGSGGFLNDTWVWDGSTWTKREPATAPPARVFASMSHDPGSGLTMLIGGTDVDNVVLRDTWFWDGTEWFEGPEGQAPLPRTLAGQAAHPPTGSTIVFGGQRGFVGRHQSDTWVWKADGAQPEPPADPRACGDQPPSPSPTASPTPVPTTSTSPGTYPPTPNDPLFAHQWGPARIRVPEAWGEAQATGHGIKVAVLDSGVDLHHEDFTCAGKIEVIPGADAVTDDGDPDDEFGHGTHVAGIIGACTDNGTGVAGTAPDVTLLPIRVLNANGSGNASQLVKGIDRAVEAGAHVINMSLSFGPASATPVFNPGLIEPAIARAIAAGVVVVATAGNDSLPVCEYPGLAKDVVCVGATDNRDAKAWYSLFTHKETGPALVAPGGQSTPFCDVDSEEILSTFAIAVDEAQGDCDGRLGYTDQSGTSMAAPHVAGVAALVYDRLGGVRSKTNAGAVINAIVSSVRDLGPPGYDPVFGSGLLDALGAVHAVEPADPTTTVRFTERSSTSGQHSDATSFEAELVDAAGQPVASQELSFELLGADGARTFTGITDEQGIASVGTTVTERPGPHQLTVRYQGDSNLSGAADISTFVVDKEDTTLELRVEGKGGKRRMIARLADQDSNSSGVGGRTVTFLSDGYVIGTATTDSDGVARFDPAGRQQGGNHTYEARFEGDDYYLRSTGTA